MKKPLASILLFFAIYSQAQVKIGSNPNTINANSLLELESTNKGLLPPRVALNNITLVAPLTGTVPAGMLVYSAGGSLTDGYYYWDGVQWRTWATNELNTVYKTANATLTKYETFVLASNDITITLPIVTVADDGFKITVKNIGTHTDLITVVGNGASTIDGVNSNLLTRWGSQTFVANNGNWLLYKKIPKGDGHFYDVDNNSSWISIQEIIEFLELHMSGPTVVRLHDETYDISETININLAYPITFQGLSYSNTTLGAATGLAGKPMFRCLSESYFKMLTFDATTLTNYGTAAGEDAIRFLGSGTYNEVKDCSFDRFYNTIIDSTNAELWIFETDISNATANGILVHSAVAGVVLKVAETDFIGCARGINLSKGSSATVQLASGGYYNSNSSDTAIIYKPSTFTFTTITIKGNLWNNTGKFIEGFDFTRSDGRDANAFVESNAGMGDKNPNCNIGVLNNAATTVASLATTWYRGNWTSNTSSSTTKWTIATNKITYQPANRRNGWFIITGNLQSSIVANINIAIVKNTVASSGLAASITRFGETTLRATTANVPFQFSMVVNLADISLADFFEIWVNSASNTTTITLLDVLWFANAQ